MPNKEQILFALSLALLGFGALSALAGWKTETPFQPPAEGRVRQEAQKRQLDIPVFGAEIPETAFAPGRDPFSRKTEMTPLPPAELPAPPLPTLARVSPGPMPMPGFMNLRMLEEPIPEGAVQFTPPAETGTGSGDEGEGEGESGEWDRRRW